MDRAQTSDSGPTFLVERYWPGIDLAALRVALVRLEAAARELADEGDHVEHLGSILMSNVWARSVIDASERPSCSRTPRRVGSERAAKEASSRSLIY